MAPGAKIEGSNVEIEGEKCGLDMSSYEDLPPPSVGGDCNGDGKDDYVFVNGSDAGSDDHGEADGNGRLDASELNAHSQKEVGGGSCTDNGDRQSEVHTGDVILDDPGEKGESGELDVLGSSVDATDKVEGGAVEINVSDRSEVDNGDGGILDNEIKVDGKVLEVGDGVNGGRENEGKVEDGELVKENGEVSPKTEIVNEDGQLAVDNGGAYNMESDVDVKARDSDVVGGDHKLVPDGVEDGESCIQIEDKCISFFGGTTTVVLDDDDDDDDDDKVRIPLGTDKGSDDRSTHKDEVQNATPIVGATLLVSDGDSEQQHPMEPQRDEDQANNLDTQITADKRPVVEDNIQPDAGEVVDRELEPLDINVKDLNPSEGDVECQSLEDGVLETQPSEGEGKVPHLSASSEPQSLEAESKEPSLDDAITENESADIQQPESQPADEGSEGAPNEAEAEVKERGDLDASNAALEQEVDSVDSEAVRSDVNQTEECEINVQNTTYVTGESLEELQTDLSQSEGAENQSNELCPEEAECEVAEQGDLGPSKTADNKEFNSMDSEAVQSTMEAEDMKMPQSDSMQSEEAGNQSGIDSASLSVEGPVSASTIHVDESKVELTAEVVCETEKVDVEGKLDLVAEVVENQESPVGDDVLLDQVAEDTGPVNVTDKEISLKDLDSEKTVVVEEVTTQSEVQAANDAAVDEDGNNLSAVCVSEIKVSDNLVHDSQTVPVSGEASNDAEGGLKSEESDLSIPVDTAAGFPASSDVDTSEEQVFDNAASSADTNSFADDTCSVPKEENGNDSLSNHVHETTSEITAENGEIDEANKSNGISNGTLKSKISFGSFVCEAPFSGNDVSMRPEVSTRSIESTSGQSNVGGENTESKTKPNNGVAILNAEANGVHSSVEHVSTDEVSSLPLEGSGAGPFKGQNTELMRRPFYYLIRVPRYEDEKLKEEIRLSELQVEEKTRSRDAIRIEYQKRKGAIIELKSVLEAAKSEERAARELVKAKKREIDSSQSLVNLAKNAITVEDVQAQILNMEHKIQHETLHLKEEKQLVREIKQLKNLKDQLYGNAQKQEELKQALDQKDQVEEQLKVLRKELASLRDNLSKAEDSVKVVRKKYDEESALLNDLYVKFKSADTVRQDAYAHLLDLRKQWSEKNKHFRSYKDDARAANDFAVAGDKDNLERHCVNQVEKFLEMWNKNDEFRKEYMKCNTRSTLRRLRTLDGRSLGPDEEPPSFENVSDHRVTVSTKVISVPAVSTIERDTPVVAKNVEENSSKKVIEQKSKTVPAKKKAEVSSKNSSAEASGRIEIEEEEEERKPTKEEEELARKAEQQRREEEAARLREQRKQAEKAKAQEALERKRKMAEKAQARAEFKARKEAEQKEKEREKRAKKKEKKRGVTSEPAASEPSVPLESPSEETTRELEVTEKPVTVAKKPQKPSAYAKQIKTTKSIPPPLRNRGKRRMQQWMWALATVVAILALFFLGNSNFLRNNSLLGFGPGY